MAWSLSIRSIISDDPNAVPSRNPLRDSVLDGPMRVMVFSGALGRLRRWVNVAPS